MPIKKTFEQLLAQKVAEDLTSYDPNRPMKIVNDLAFINNLANSDGSKIYGIVQSGTGNRLVTSDSLYIEQAQVILFYVNVNYLQEYLKYLSDYAKSESHLTTSNTMSDSDSGTTYYYKSKFGTPLSNGITFKVGIYDYVEIMLTASILYSETPLTIGTETILINSFILKNCIDYSYNTTPEYQEYKAQGYSKNVADTISMNKQASLTVLLDSTNALHNALDAQAKSGSALGAQATIVIGSNSITGSMTVASQKSASGFTYLSVQIKEVIVDG